MNNALFQFAKPANETVKEYRPGSPERLALEKELEKQSSEVIEIPIIIGGKEAGVFGQIHPKVSANFELSMPVFAALIDFDAILSNAGGTKSYKHLPKFPAVTRDIAMLCDDATEVGSIEEIIKKCSGELLEELNLFDVYKGKQIPDGKKSVAYSLVLRSASKTLEESEVTSVMNDIVSNLESKLGAELRKN